MKKYIYYPFLFAIFIINSCTTSEIPIPEPIVEEVTYEIDVKGIIDNSCVTCHINGGAASFLPLVNYTQVKNSAEAGNLIERMNSTANPMPPNGLLSPDIRAIIDKWKDDGFLEN